MREEMSEAVMTGDGERLKTLQIFGMEIHHSPTGRRVWPKPFKQAIANKLSNREISVNDAARECGVSRRQIRDWIRSVEGMPASKVDARIQKSKASFAQLTISNPHALPALNLQVASESVSIRAGLCEILLPRDYPVELLISLIRSIRS